MLRKRIAILFFLVAQVIILGHSVILHHHHLDEVTKHHNHVGKEGKDQHPDENPLQLAFSGFTHIGEQVSFTHSDTIKYVVEKDALKAIDALPWNFMLPAEYAVTFQKSTFPPDRANIYKSPQNGIHKLRGPPTFIVA
jgi:hypothetical protein